MTAREIIQGFLDFARENEWNGRFESCPRSCCQDWYYKCLSCDAEQKNGHAKGCTLQATIVGAETFLTHLNNAEEVANECLG